MSNDRPPSVPSCRSAERRGAKLDAALSAELFRALSDPNRLALLVRLAAAGRPATVGEISCCLPVDLSVVSRHLAQLRAAGVLRAEKRGRETLYCVRYDAIASTLRSIADAIDACCPPSARNESHYE
jgi:DNA-binding transcriptional ArsR family regulator